MSANIPLLKISGLAPPFSGDVRSLVHPRIKGSTVRSYLISKGLPVLAPVDSADPDLVRNWIKALPSGYLDASRGFTSSAMVFSVDVFAAYRNMDASVPWSAVSLKDVRDAIKMLAADLSLANSLTDLTAYASVPNAQRAWSYMLLRIILDDLHGDNPDAIHAPAIGADYPDLVVKPASFGEWVLAMARRAAPWAFGYVTGGGTNPGDNDVDPVRRHGLDDADKGSGKGGGRKPGGDENPRSSKKRRRRRHSSSSTTDSESDSEDEDDDLTFEGCRKGFTDSQAQLAVLGLNSRARVSGADAIVNLTKQFQVIRSVRDIDEFVGKFVELSRHVQIDLTGNSTVELAALDIFRGVEDDLGARPTTENVNSSLLGTLESILDRAEESKAIRFHGVRIFKALRTAVRGAIKRIDRFSKNASKESNLDRLRGRNSSTGFINLTPREQALKDSFQAELTGIKKLVKSGQSRQPRDKGNGSSEGTRNPKSATAHPMGTLIAAVVKKKEMTDQEAKKVALELAGSTCISCRGVRQRGVCAAHCGGSTVHADILKALATKSL